VSLGKPPGRSAGDAGAAPGSKRSLLSLWKPPGRPAAAPGPAASSPGPLLGVCGACSGASPLPGGPKQAETHFFGLPTVPEGSKIVRELRKASVFPAKT
jgi:hypothetical protein